MRDIDISVESLPLYIPNVYQETIFDIDYQRLKANGIEVISYDIDDTIGTMEKNWIRSAVGIFGMSEEAELFNSLKSMGFKTVLLSNNVDRNLVKGFHEKLQTDYYIDNAGKPDTTCFDTVLGKYAIESNKMAHIGNSIIDDVYGGNKAGVITCLVRRKGRLYKLREGQEQEVRKLLKEQGLWRKHHKYTDADQYYQLGDTQTF